MKKLVTESLSDFLSESTKLDPTLGGQIEKDTHKLLTKDQNKDENELEDYTKEVTESESSAKKGFHDNIEKDTLDNENYRKVLYTAKNMQLVLMTLKPGENIGMESHESDQFFRFEEGIGQCIINENKYDIKDGDSILVPGGAEHDIINTNDNEELKLYTLYSPPNHKDGVLFKDKESAEESEKSGEDKFDRKTTE
jgi:mannose-6-phosphate isomerase-like protein (cupin superfamily)